MRWNWRTPENEGEVRRAGLVKSSDAEIQDLGKCSDTCEPILATLVAEPALSSCEFAEVTGGYWADIIVKLEDNSSGRL